jgi:hypothetical protein
MRIKNFLYRFMLSLPNDCFFVTLNDSKNLLGKRVAHIFRVIFLLYLFLLLQKNMETIHIRGRYKKVYS